MPSTAPRLTDLHSHLIPDVDDGARDLTESRAALVAMRDSGVTALVTTPHLRGSLTLSADRLAPRLAELDAGWDQLHDLGAQEFPGLRLERGVELMLDTPVPDLSDERLRLAGGPFALVEFPNFRVPPNSQAAINHLREKGWRPILAHPERYREVATDPSLIPLWREAGALLQLNAGSLLGEYGAPIRALAWQLLEAGSVDYLASDYHARGGNPLTAARAELERRGAAEHAHLLLSHNPALILEGREPEPVAPLPRRNFWRRLLDR